MKRLAPWLEDWSTPAASASEARKMPAILLINGFPGYHRNRDLAVVAAAGGARVYVVRPPGRKPATEVFSFGAMIECIASLLREIVGAHGDERVGVVSFCFGAFAYLQAMGRARPSARFSLMISPLLDISDYRRNLPAAGLGSFDHLLNSGVELLEGRPESWRAEWTRMEGELPWEWTTEQLSDVPNLHVLFAPRDRDLSATHRRKIRRALRSHGHSYSVTKLGDHFHHQARQEPCRAVYRLCQRLAARAHGVYSSPIRATDGGSQ